MLIGHLIYFWRESSIAYVIFSLRFGRFIIALATGCLFVRIAGSLVYWKGPFMFPYSVFIVDILKSPSPYTVSVFIPETSSSFWPSRWSLVKLAWVFAGASRLFVEWLRWDRTYYLSLSCFLALKRPLETLKLGLSASSFSFTNEVRRLIELTD